MVQNVAVTLTEAIPVVGFICDVIPTGYCPGPPWLMWYLSHPYPVILQNFSCFIRTQLPPYFLTKPSNSETFIISDKFSLGKLTDIHKRESSAAISSASSMFARGNNWYFSTVIISPFYRRTVMFKNLTHTKSHTTNDKDFLIWLSWLQLNEISENYILSNNTKFPDWSSYAFHCGFTFIYIFPRPHRTSWHFYPWSRGIFEY